MHAYVTQGLWRQSFITTCDALIGASQSEPHSFVTPYEIVLVMCLFVRFTVLHVTTITAIAWLYGKDLCLCKYLEPLQLDGGQAGLVNVQCTHSALI